MRSTMKLTGMAMCLIVTTVSLCAQTYTEKITKTLSFGKVSDANTVIIANINGNVTVEGYGGTTVTVDVIKTVTGKTPERLEKGKQQIQLGELDQVDTLVLFVEGTGASFGRKTGVRRVTGNYRYNWCCDDCRNGCECRTDYDYKMDFVVKVPARTHVVSGTVNNGNISISKVNGVVHADNVNGSIALTDLVREATASTINGDVDIEYASNPVKDCRFYSLNGDINALFQKGLAASMSFESFNGDFYTNINKLETMPATVEKQTDPKGVKYKVNSNRYRIGNGGAAMLDFETFNGDVFIKERAN